ncbi:hypothetical protein C8J57DRAFT_1499455 [Mycena rebaudengoi]|nr:hypothetical protein C8J57DRAFT_1499455 [Mycena rebaudengoi]
MFKPIITVLVLFTLIVSATPAAPEAVDASESTANYIINRYWLHGHTLENKDSSLTVRRALPTPEVVDSSELYVISNCEIERGIRGAQFLSRGLP